MKVVVIGSGLIGLTTAYFLRVRGHNVTVIDRQDSPGRETSFANGALLTPSMAEPWNTPGCWRVLLSSLGRANSPLQLRFEALPQLVGWGIRFLANSKREAYERNTVKNLRLALYSLKVMQSLRQQTHIEYGAKARGALKIFRSAGALDRAMTETNRLGAEGLTFRQLSRSETVEFEPALAPIADQLSGAIYYALDETGDSHQFCVELAAQARELGIEFSFGTTVLALKVASGRVTAVHVGEKCITADQYIVAAGSYSAPLLKPLGISLPVRPAKGYSVTFNAPDALKIPVIDDEMHTAVVPIGNALRVAGTAEFSGFDLSLHPARIANLVGLTKKLLPRSELDLTTGKPWCGLRAMSADGVPLIGRTTISNLWVNTGHGHLGWTMAAGAGCLLADLVSGKGPSINSAPYDPRRFG